MKKSICLILVMLLLTGCMPGNNKIVEPVTFYYCNRNITYTGTEDVISKEIRDGDGMNGDLYQLISLYLQGPDSDELYCNIPAGTEVKAVDIRYGIVYLVLSESFTALTGMDLSLTCTCLALTLYSLTEADAVSISAENGQLDGKLTITIMESDILLLDESLNILGPE